MEKRITVSSDNGPDMGNPVLETENRLTYMEAHAAILGVVVGYLVRYALELQYTTVAVGGGVVFVAIALGLTVCEKIPVAQRTIRREPWYALVAFLVGSAILSLLP